MKWSNTLYLWKRSKPNKAHYTYGRDQNQTKHRKGENLWKRSKPNQKNEGRKPLFFANCKWEQSIGYLIFLIKADSVIRCMKCINKNYTTTQNSSCLPWSPWCWVEYTQNGNFMPETPFIFSFFFVFWPLKI